MAQKNRTTLKSYFETGDKPTQSQFEDLIDSSVNNTDDNATTTKKGIVEQATIAEVTTGTDDTRFVTPKGAKHAAETHAPVLSVNGQTGNVAIGDDSGWLQAALINGFTNYGSNFQIARFRKKNGVVHVEGLIKGGGPSVPIFVLPPGFWPENKLIFSSIGNNSLARINIDANGEVVAIVHHSQWISLSGISFIAD